MSVHIPYMEHMGPTYNHQLRISRQSESVPKFWGWAAWPSIIAKYIVASIGVLSFQSNIPWYVLLTVGYISHYIPIPLYSSYIPSGNQTWQWQSPTYRWFSCTYVHIYIRIYIYIKSALKHHLHRMLNCLFGWGLSRNGRMNVSGKLISLRRRSVYDSGTSVS